MTRFIVFIVCGATLFLAMNSGATLKGDFDFDQDVDADDLAVFLNNFGRINAMCYADAECSNSSSGAFCQKPTGQCAGAGRCAPVSAICPDVWDPVCGCDGVTYGNSCEASSAGVSVDHTGECVVTCTGNSDCSATDYCSKVDCATVKGECLSRPAICPDVWDPVCGCDGVTYGNSCEAASAGANVEYGGVCVTTCTGNSDCSATDYCSKVDCAASKGECRIRPVICPDVWDPVCGCDGVTYGNSCEAASAGVSATSAGVCQ